MTLLFVVYDVLSTKMSTIMTNSIQILCRWYVFYKVRVRKWNWLWRARHVWGYHRLIFLQIQMSELQFSSYLTSKNSSSALRTISSFIRLTAEGVRSTSVWAEGIDRASRGCGCEQDPLLRYRQAVPPVLLFRRLGTNVEWPLSEMGAINVTISFAFQSVRKFLSCFTKKNKWRYRENIRNNYKEIIWRWRKSKMKKAITDLRREENYKLTYPIVLITCVRWSAVRFCV